MTHRAATGDSHIGDRTSFQLWVSYQEREVRFTENFQMKRSVRVLRPLGWARIAGTIFPPHVTATIILQIGFFFQRFFPFFSLPDINNSYLLNRNLLFFQKRGNLWFAELAFLDKGSFHDLFYPNRGGKKCQDK